VWVPLLPALVWGKCHLSGPEIPALWGRAAKLSAGVGFPLRFCGLLLFGRMDPARIPAGELVSRSAILALVLLPFYGALIATNVFQARHARGREKGEARPFMVRVLGGTAILATNLVAAWIMFLALIGSSGIYRQMRSWGW
jgi:hypothetical protein